MLLQSKFLGLRNYSQIWCMSMKLSGGLVQLFDLFSVNEFHTPTTFARYAKPRSFCQLFSAHWPSLNIMCSSLARVTQPFVRAVRWRMVANVDSIGFVVGGNSSRASGPSLPRQIKGLPARQPDVAAPRGRATGPLAEPETESAPTPLWRWGALSLRSGRTV